MFDIEIYTRGLVVALGLSVVGWLIHLPVRNASVADSIWSLLFVAMALTYLTAAPEINDRGYLSLFLITLWGARLSVFLTRRNWGEAEDRRYAEMRARNDPGFQWKSFYLVFGLQAILAWIISLPLLAGIVGSGPLGWVDTMGVALYFVGLLFEAVGDQQLADFRSNPVNRAQVMDRGLWRYTRHPNYFGELCIWWGLYLLALGAGGWWSIVSPLLMTWLLLRVSGVALLERDIAARRPAYRDYVLQTNVLFPGPPRPAPGPIAAGDAHE